VWTVLRPRDGGVPFDPIVDDDVWSAIEWLTGIIEGVELDGVAVMQIVGQVG
jgi:hypothetical protein